MYYKNLRLDDEEISRSYSIEEVSVHDIAIIGMAVQAPGAENIDRFWDNLRQGSDHVGPFPKGRMEDVMPYLAITGLDDDLTRYHEGSFLQEVDKFDYSFFRISPKEASLMNPNQRLFLENSWRAIEDAGYGGEKIRGTRTGVFVGYNGDAFHDYKRLIERFEPHAMSLSITGNLSSMMAGRLSYLLDLKGQAVTVDTACSSSLVAVHMAVRALRNRECDMAIAGSVKVNMLPFHKDIRIGIESSDARARTFDDRSDGTGAGEGAGTVLLKPLYAAQRDGDHIYAVIKGSAVNQDGHASGLTAPDAGAQTDVICKAWEDAGIDPETIGYIEAHGTGTKLGDPIEIEALQRAFRRYTDRRQFCAVGTVKTNIGHLDHAAGIAGLVKSALMMKHQAIPPIVHFERPNRNIDFVDSPLYVNDRYKPLEPAGSGPRRCGISSFGMSGTNCHVVLEEAPLREASPYRYDDEEAVFVLSAQSEETMLNWINSYLEQADRIRSLPIQDVCYTAATGRAHLSCRLAILVRDTDDMLMQLKRIAEAGWGAEIEQVYCGNAGNAERIKASDLQSMRRDKAAICRRYVEGADIEWEALYHDEVRYKVSLPTYPFQRTRSWIDMAGSAGYPGAAHAAPRAKAAPAVILTGKRGEDDYSAADLAIAMIWSEALGVRQFSVDDHFFELGGDSILALWVTNRLNESFPIRWDPSALFRFPTIREIAAAVEADVNTDNALRLPEPQAAAQRERYPMSSAQKRMYLLQQFEPASTAYHLPQALLLEGPLDANRLISAFQAMLDRHDVFRASFFLDGDEPVQSFAERAELVMETIDTAESDVADAIRRCIRPFDLTKAPLIRLLLMRISERKHVLLVDQHHLISDGTSMGILIRELMQLYQGQALAAPAMQYKDYAVWQNETARSPFMQAQQAYWLNAFRGEVPVLQLPTDYARPAVKSAEGKTFAVVLDEATTSRVKQLAKEKDTTLFILLLAAYNVLLHRYSGQEDIVVGSPISGRPHYNLESIVGMFVNTLALRNFPTSEQSFLQFLNGVKENAILAYRHQDYPFEELVRSLGWQDKSRNPLFDTMFILQNMDIPDITLDQLSCTPYPIDNESAKFDLMIQTFETDNGLRFVVEYCTRLFKEDTVQRMMRHYCNILQEVALRPETPIGRIPMLADDEVRQIVEAYNRSDGRTFPPRPIHCLFEEQANQAPDRVALVWREQRITYRMLNERANQLAHLLRAKGVGPDSVVGIVAERSPELVIGMMAILKAGGAYLPIDPQLPSERIRYMLQDSGTTVVCIQEEWSGAVPYEGATIPLTDSVAANEQRSNPDLVNEAGDLMYVIYTSGSTGQPKGVMVEHRSFHNFAYSIREHLGGQFGSEDRCLSLTSISFDVSVCELFLPLVFGASLVLYPAPKLTDVNMLANLLVDESITFAYLPPTLLNEICDLLEPQRHKVTLDKLLVGVEPIKDWTLERYLRLNPGMRIINGYGPTETTICSNMHIYGSEMPAGKNVPIGKPMHHNQNYILNEALMPVPIGVTGELYIAGAGLARGYLHRPELTRERFVDNPFIPGSFMYRTGDLARWKDNGEVEYSGRTDDQVKIRGYRVEPGEIEATMLRQPNVQSAVVIPIEEQSGHQALCAYIVSRVPVSAAQMRSELLRHLPDYMVPSYYVQLDEIPVTANGKVDRRALPRPERMHRNSEYVPPEGEQQRKLCEIWQHVLELDRIGMHDNFFELGGHSLKAIALVSKIHKELGVEMSFGDVFQYPTVDQMARAIADREQRAFVSIPVIEERDDYPLSSAQKRIFMIYHTDKTSTNYNMPCVLLLEGEVNVERLTCAFERLIARHEALRSVFEWRDGEPVQRVLPSVDFEMDVTEGKEDEIERIAAAFVQPFDLGSAPVLRVSLVRLKPDRHILLLDMHHIVSDGVSIQLFVNEMIALYHGAELAPLRIQYKDFAAWEGRYFAAEAFRKQKDYWLDKLSDLPPPLRMPLDFKRPTKRSYHGNTLRAKLAIDDAKALQDIARQSKLTMNTLLMSLYAVLLNQYSGQEELVIGSTVAGRKHEDLANVMGVFINFLPIRIKVNAEQPYIQWASHLSEDMIEAYEHQDYPFDEMVAALNLRYDPSRNPAYDTMILFHQPVRHSGEIKLQSLKASPYPLANHTSKLDLKLDVYAGDHPLDMVLELQFSTDLFRESTMQKLLDDFQELIRRIAADPSVPLAAIQLFSAEEIEALTAKRKFNDELEAAPAAKLAISATFTAEPVSPYIKYWSNQFDLPVQVQFAGYNQVFQELLEPDSLLSRNNGANVLLVRFEDWLRDDHLPEDGRQLEVLEQTYAELVYALQAKEKTVPYLVGVFPVSTHLPLSAAVRQRISLLNERWRTELAGMTNVYPIDLTGLPGLYGIREVFDPATDATGHLPFREAFYAAMGAMIARKWVASRTLPFKVIVLDCDQTLWSGICGEEGALGVRVDGPYAALQKFMLDRCREGMLLCLSSKNNEEDVWDVFAHNPGMVLSKDDLAAWKINWQSKSSQVKELARELNVGLDSFIFVDDNAMECSDMMLHCPEVLTLRLPSDPAHIPLFLNHVWAFDRLSVTEEDKQRSEMYVVERKRKEMHAVAGPSLDHFLSGLQLQVSMRELAEEEMPRAAQLTQRTNQFNLSTIRRTESEIRKLAMHPDYRCRIVEVKDRFGHYGLVGLVIVKVETSRMFVDTFLLSCRVLGRRVEEAVAVGLKNMCGQEGIEELEASFVPTAKNQPFVDFMERSGWLAVEEREEQTLYSLPLSTLPEVVDHIAFFYDVPIREVKAGTTRTERAAGITKPTFAMDHVAMAVSDIQAEKAAYESLGYSSGKTVYDPLQQVYLAMLEKSGHASVELVAPVDSFSPVYNMVRKNGSIPYHVCYRVGRFEQFLGHLTDNGIRYEIVSPAKPAVLFDRKPVMFIHVAHVGLIELLETEENAASDLRHEVATRSTIQSLTANPDDAVRFYSCIGYDFVGETHDPIRNLRILRLSSLENGGMELLQPQQAYGAEHEFLKQNGAHLFQMVLEGKERRLHTGDIPAIEVENVHPSHFMQGLEAGTSMEGQLLHRMHYAPLACVSAEGLVSRKEMSEGKEAAAVGTEHVAPRTELEAQIAEVWKEILELQSVGIHDDFFDLGGNSIKLVYLKVALEKRNLVLGDEVVHSVMTIAGLAASIRANQIIRSDQDGGRNESG